MPEKKPKTIEDVSSCSVIIQYNSAEGYHEMNPYCEGMPNQRVKPAAGYNKVACDFYMPEEGKCSLRHFFPRYVEIDYGMCKFSGVIVR